MRLSLWCVVASLAIGTTAFAAPVVPGSLSTPTITVTSPNGGESWQAGTTQTITWTSTNPTGNVGIVLSRLDQGSYQHVSWLGSAPMSAGSYDCSISEYVGDGSDYVIGLEWSSGGSSGVSDYSDAPFAITGSLPIPTITVTSPNGGETWQAGTTQTITWTSTNPTGDVYIELFRMDQGSYQYVCGLGLAPMSAGSYDCSISAYVGDGSDYVIELYGSIGAWDESDAPFAITGSLPLPTITVTSPNGGESWQAGTTQTITWTSTNPTGYVDISLYRLDQDSYQWVSWLGSAPMSSGSYDCNLSAYVGDGSDYVIQLSCSIGAWDESDAPFAITGSLVVPTITVTSPNGGEIWQAGTTQTITWTSTNPTGDVGIYLYRLNQGSYQWVSTLGWAPMSAGSYDCSTSACVGDGSDYVIELYWWSDGIEAWDDSDASFAITGSLPRPTITVTSPNGGETWQAGTTQTITWTSTNPTGDVDIEMYRLDQGGYEYVSWLGSAPVSAGSYDCSLSAYVGDGSDYVIQLNWWSSDGIGVSDYSDAPFAITGSLPLPTITVTSPNGGETWQAGTTQTITWTSTTTTGNVYIELYRLDEGSYQWVSGLGSAPMSAGSYDCSISAYVGDGSDYVIQLHWWSDGIGASDYSDAPFAIAGSLPKPTFMVTSPNGGESWQAGTTQAITWTSTNPTGNVYIDLCRLDQGGYQWVSQLGSAPMSAGSYACSLSAYVGDGSNYVILLSWSSDDIGVSDDSDAPFAITGSLPKPTITITSPAGGETWQAGTTQTITWTSTNAIGDVLVWLISRESGASTVIGRTAMAAGQLSWSICPTFGDQSDCYIMIQSVGSGLDVAAYGNSFSIAGSSTPPQAPSVTLTHPVGGEVLSAGQTERIAWTSTNADGNVSIWLVTSGMDFIPVGTASMSQEYFDWQIPDCMPMAATSEYAVYLISDCGQILATTTQSFRIESPVSAADFNGDCSVDSQDADLFVGCSTAPAMPYDPAHLSSACWLVPDANDHIAADFDRDGDVDQSDFGIFQQCWSGAGEVADPNCGK